MIWFKLTASFCSSPLSVVHCARHQVRIAWKGEISLKYNDLIIYLKCKFRKCNLFAFYFGLGFTIVKCTRLNNSCKADLPQRADLLWEKGSLGTGCGQKHTWDVTLTFVKSNLWNQVTYSSRAFHSSVWIIESRLLFTFSVAWNVM